MSQPTERARVSHWRQGRMLWGWWVLANAVGGAIGGALIESVGGVGAAFLPAALGMAEWLVLRRYLAPVGWWVVATTLGGVSGLGMIFYTGPLAFLLLALPVHFLPGPDILDAYTALFYPLLAAVNGAMIGGLVGLLQQWVVLERHLRFARWWTVASTVGGAAGAGIVGWDLLQRAIARTFELLDHLAGRPWSPSPSGWAGLLWAPHGSVSGAAFGTAYALITGVALAWLLWRTTEVGHRA